MSLTPIPDGTGGAHPRTAAGVIGLHHVAVVTADVERAADFYGRLLGLRDLGSGVAPRATPRVGGAIAEVPARYFGDVQGRAGSLVVLIEERGASRGKPGIGGTHHFALAVEDRAHLLMWKRRFLDAGYAVNGILDRHYFQSIYVQDPDGTIVELATLGPGWTRDEEPAHLGEAHREPPAEMVVTNRDRARIQLENWGEPVPEITTGMIVQGMHHVTAIGASITRIDEFVGGTLAMRRVKRTSNFDDPGSHHWYWGVGDGHPGTLVTYFERNPEREPVVRMGAGQVAHYAVGADTPLDEARARLLRDGRPVSDVREFAGATTSYQAIATVDPDGQPVIIASTTGDPSYGAIREKLR